MALTIGKYNVCFLDLLTDDKNGTLSTTKIWLHIANIIMSKVMLTQKEIGWELLAAYGAVVGGSHVAILFIKWKYRDAKPCVDTSDDQK